MKNKIIIKKPVITEKGMMDTDKGVYAFKVDKTANKIQIKQELEKLFNVKVKDIRTSIIPSRARRRGRIVGRIPAYKKAIVKLKSGKIDIFGKA